QTEAEQGRARRGAEAEVTQLRSLLTDFSGKLKGLRHQLTTTQAERDESRRRVAEVVGKERGLEAVLVSIRAELDAMRSRLQASDAERVALLKASQERDEAQAHEVQEVTAQLHEAEARAGRAEAETARLKAEVSEQMTRRERERERLRQQRQTRPTLSTAMLDPELSQLINEQRSTLRPPPSGRDAPRDRDDNLDGTGYDGGMDDVELVANLYKSLNLDSM
ncbi:hypothetical protein KIPB_010384, partial [Kipferlia bialata]